eukprot:SAG31_NODE_296_length_18227_cov_39.663173_1_plen_179_part_00
MLVDAIADNHAGLPIFSDAEATFRAALEELRAAPQSVEVQQHWCNGSIVERFHSPSTYCVLLHDGRSIDVADDDDHIRDGRSDETHDGVQDDASTDVDDGNGKKPWRARTVKEAVEEGGWTISQGGGGHIKLRRAVWNGQGEKVAQTCTLACTPSDHRARKNAVALLRRKDRQLLEYE